MGFTALNPSSALLRQLMEIRMRYFFHLQGSKRIADEDGAEFPDDRAAMAEAALVARDLARHRDDAAAWRVVVTDANGHDVAEVGLATGARLLK
jgi:hypothetical protein